MKPKAEQRQARGWLAIGEAPIGLIAIGGIARGLIAFGGVAIGPFAFGGLGIGICSLGGFALGIWSYGGIALGWVVHGGMGVAWQVAFAGFALSRQFGVGGFVVAPHVNDAAARAAVAESAWLGLTTQPWFPIAVPVSIVLVFVLLGLAGARLARSQRRGAEITDDRAGR